MNTHLVLPFMGAKIGGSHLSSMTFASAACEKGAACAVIAPGGSMILDEARHRGFDAIASGERAAFRKMPWEDVARLAHRRDLLKHFGPRAALICNDIAALQSWAPAARMLGLPVLYFHRSLNKMWAPNRWVIRLADRVICISQACRENLAFLADDVCDVIHNSFVPPQGLDPEALKRALKAEFGFPENAILCGFVGNLWQRKRPLFFLEACKIVSEGAPRARFVVFGREGDLSIDDLKKHAATLEIADRIAFAGFRLPADANIASLDVLMAPALAEPFGRTLIEAALAGVPYVATDDAGHGEIARAWGGGELVAKDALVSTFAAATLRAVEANPSRALTTEQRAAVARELSPPEHAAKVLAAIEHARESASAPRKAA